MPNLKELLLMAGAAGLVVLVGTYLHKQSAAAAPSAPSNAGNVIDLSKWLSSSASSDVAQSANYWDLYTVNPPAGAGDVNAQVASAHMGPGFGA